MQIFKRTLSTLLAVCLCAGTLAGAFPLQSAGAVSPAISHDSGIEMTGSSSLGNILAQAVADSYDTEATVGEDTLTSISSIDMEDGKAYVTFMTVCDASLVVALYDEATGRMVTSATASVSSADNKAELAFDTMPEDYFVVKGYLVDPQNQAPLSKVYESMAFTKEQQEFYAMTPDDFDSKRVLMLDDASNGNFAVFNENVLLLKSEGESNVIASSDVQNGVYTIEHADETLVNLKSGDIFALDFGEEFPLLVYADTITVDENTVTVTAGDAPLDAYFEFFRLDSGYCEPDYKAAGLADGVTVVDRGQKAKSSAKLAGASDTAAEEEKTEDGDKKEEEKDKIDFDVEMKYSVDGEGNEVFTITDGVTINLTEYKLAEISEEPSFIPKSAEVKGDAKITGKIDCDLSARLKLNLNKNNTGDMFVSLELINKISPDVSLSGNLSATMSLLKDKDKPIEIPLKAGFKLKAKPEIKVEGNAAIDLNYSVTKTIGFSYDETREDKLTEIKETQKDEVKFTIDGSVYVGINLHPSIVWMHEKVFLADVEEFSGGLILTGKLVDVSADVSNEDVWHDDKAPTVSGSLVEQAREKHACKICVDGELKVQFKIKMKIHIFDLTQGEDELETKPDDAEKEPDGLISLVIPELSIELPGIHLTYFYLSLMDEDGNAQLKFAFTKCPNKMFLCDISCMDADTLEAITDAKLFISNTDGQQLNTELKEDGKVWVWMPLGSYTITAESEHYSPYEGKYALTYRSYTDEKSTDINAEEYALAINGKKTQSITQKLTPVKHKVVVKVENEKGEELKDASILCSYASKKVLKQDAPFGEKGFSGNLFNEMMAQNSALNQEEKGYLLPDGTHKFTVSCEGYLTKVAEAVVDGKDLEIVVVMKKGTSPISPIGQGGGFSGFISEDGSLYMMGNNGAGQLGDGTKKYKKTLVKVMDDVKAVSLGYLHSAAIKEDGRLYVWGDNVYYGQLGTGTTMGSDTPIELMGDVISVSLGYGHSAAVTKKGYLYTWGNNYYGQLGDGTKINHSTPVKILENVVTVSLGDYHSAAITEDGSLYMWGENNYGQLGNGNTKDSYAPVKIMDGVIAVSLGSGHSAAIKKDGSLYMWGYNGSGQLGTGDTQASYTPIKIMDNVVEVSLGSMHSAAIKEDGSLYTWGDNFCGQLGDGTKSNKNKPVKIMDSIAAVGIGSKQSAAVATDGTLYVWGAYLGTDIIYSEGDYTFPTSPIRLTDGIAVGELAFDAPFSSVSSFTTTNSSHLAKSPITTGENTAEFTDLTPDTLYNFYCMKSHDAENSLGSDNLLYIEQVTSDENGGLTVRYSPKDSCEDADVFVVAADGTTAVYGESADDSIAPVRLKMGDTTTVDATGELISSDPTVVEVGEDGVLTAVGEGMTAIFAMDAENGTLVTVIEVAAPDCGKGDLDNDGAVNAVDAALLLVDAAAVGSGGDSGLTESQKAAADVNEDGECNAVDAAMILQYAAAVGSGYAGTFDAFFAA